MSGAVQSTRPPFPPDRAPDLLRGFMVNTYTYYNRFQTFIDCALFGEAPDGREKFAYLSSRCRPESIGQDELFSKVGLYDFAAIHSSDGTLALHAGSAETSRNFLKARPAHYVSPLLHPSHVECPQAEITVLPLDAVLNELQSAETGRDNLLYLRCDWEDASGRWSLFAPCRYTNFPHPDMDHRDMWRDKPNYSHHEDRYIQPISGPVLFPLDGTYYQAFIAAHIDRTGTRRIEFSLMDAVSFFDLRRQGARGLCILRRLISRSWVGRYFRLLDYHRIIPVNGACTIYRYLHHA